MARLIDRCGYDIQFPVAMRLYDAFYKLLVVAAVAECLIWNVFPDFYEEAMGPANNDKVSRSSESTGDGSFGPGEGVDSNGEESDEPAAPSTHLCRSSGTSLRARAP